MHKIVDFHIKYTILIRFDFAHCLFTFSYRSNAMRASLFLLRVMYPAHIHHRDLVTIEMCWHLYKVVGSSLQSDILHAVDECPLMSKTETPDQVHLGNTSVGDEQDMCCSITRPRNVLPHTN